ncbi:MAG TPA: NfeD family protein [Allosphingosinicella sp.]|jgi:hypothetical protein
MIGLEDHWWWLIAALVLAIAEMLVPGFFLIWLAGAALLTGMLTLGFSLPVSLQLLFFAVSSVAAVHAARRWFRNNPIRSSDPLLNERASRLVGETVVVESAIEHGRGRVRVGDSVWNCRGPDTAVGSRVRITGSDGTCLTVQPEQSLPPA